MIIATIIAVIVIDIGSMVIIRRRRSVLRCSDALSRWRWVLWLTGVVLAFGSVLVGWPYNASTRIVGFPIPGVIFELWTNSKGESFWADFVGPMTLPALAADFVLCLYLPQVILATLHILRSEEQRRNKPLQPTGSADG